MKFTVSTFVTLVAAAAAAPSAREAATAVSQSNQKKLAEYETECPTVNINCCVPVNTENANPMGGGDQTYAAGLVGGLLDGLTELVSNAAGGEKPLPGKQYCSPSTSGSTLTKDLLAALGGYNVKPDTTHLCDLNGDINIACCPNQGNGGDSSSSCTVIGTINNDDDDKRPGY